MGSLSASAALRLPVRLHGIAIGQPVDLLLDLERWHVIGFVVRCRDESQRFLPFAAAQLHADEIAVASALLLLDDVGFYRARGTSYRSLLGGEVQSRGRVTGSLRDVVLAGGDVTALELELPAGGSEIVASAGSRVVPSRASAA